MMRNFSDGVCVFYAADGCQNALWRELHLSRIQYLMCFATWCWLLEWFDQRLGLK